MQGEFSFISSVSPAAAPAWDPLSLNIRSLSRRLAGRMERDTRREYLTRSDDAEVPEITNLTNETSDNENTLWSEDTLSDNVRWLLLVRCLPDV